MESKNTKKWPSNMTWDEFLEYLEMPRGGSRNVTEPDQCVGLVGYPAP